MRRVLSLKIALASLLFAACVTINVYFPAAAADKAEHQIINDITKGTSGTPPQSNFTPPRESEEPNMLVAAIGQVLYALVPAAHAQNAEAALNVSSPAVSRIKSSMGARFGELEKFFASGAVGLTRDGLIEVRDINAVALPSSAWCRKTMQIARSCTPRLRAPATTPSGRRTSRRVSRAAGWRPVPSPAGTTRTIVAPGSRSRNG